MNKDNFPSRGADRSASTCGSYGDVIVEYESTSHGSTGSLHYRQPEAIITLGLDSSTSFERCTKLQRPNGASDPQ